MAIELIKRDTYLLGGGSIDLSEYATKEFVNNAIEGIEIPEVDLDGYATEDYVDSAVRNIRFPETDLSNYYNKEQTNNAISTAIGKIDFPETDLSNYYTKAQTNNAINEAVPDLTGYATKDYVVAKVAEAQLDGEVDLSIYATTEYVNSLVNNFTQCLLTTEIITIGNATYVPVSKVVLDYNQIELTMGESIMLAASILPSNATNKTIIWNSNSNSVATINNGLVYAVKEGNAVITAYAAENNAIRATCAVSVVASSSGGEEPQATLVSISATYTGGDVPIGTSVNDLEGITVIANYSNGTSETVTSYTLTGTIKEGSNVITVTYSGKTTTFNVNGITETVGKIQLSTLPYVTSMLCKKDGTKLALNDGNYVEVPYTEGMLISTVTNTGWVNNYPPFVVLDNGVYSVPEYTTGEPVIVYAPSNYGIISIGTNYTHSFYGCTDSAKVFVNFILDTSHAEAIEGMNATEAYWYIPGGEN